MTSVSETLKAVLSLDPGASALEFEDRIFTWDELSAQVRSIQSAIVQSGVAAPGDRGTRVGVLLHNHPPSYAALLACVIDDHCLVTLNPLLPADKLIDDLRGLRLPVVVAERADLDRAGVREALREAGSAVVALEPGFAAPAALLPGFEHPASTVPRERLPDVMIEMLSSGTTGKPKRIPMERTVFERAFAAGNAYERGRDGDDRPRLRSGVVFLSLPLTHISGAWSAIQQVAGGRTALLMEKFRIDTWRAAVKRHRPKLFSGPPTMLRMILDADIPREDLASIVALRTGTAPLDPDLADAFFDRYGIPVLQTYGATEFAGAVAGWSVEDFKQHRVSKRGAVGRLHAGVEGRITHPDTGAEVPIGEEGLLEVRGRQLGRTDWLRTTDRAVLDADGFLFIRGRHDGAILRGGFKVHPEDVVRVLESHPAIREASVVGVKDERLGEVPVAALLLRPDQVAPSEESLGAWLKVRLSPYQVPVKFRFVDELPRTPSMKVSQPDVRALFATR